MDRLASLAAMLVLAFAPQARAADCGALLAEHVRTDLALDFDAFDQADATGWRPLADAGCDAETATLIARYAAARPHPHPVLAWHRAQALARAGDTAAAIAAARATLRPADAEARADFQWNAYAEATIAFLQGDRATLQARREQLARAAAGHPENQPNLNSVDRLQRCFGQPYKQAYLCPGE